VTRVVASIVETCHDENGIIWPINVAPYTVQIIPLNVGDAEVMKVTNTIYGELMAAGIDVLMDDRDQRPGFKFKDADLIGLPIRITIGGKGLAEGIAEIKLRTETDPKKIPLADAVGYVKDLVAERQMI
jgi:prolyl-tRNA synthetase